MLNSERVLEQSNVNLCSPGGRLNCLGKFKADATYKEKGYTFLVYVIRGQSVNNFPSRVIASSMGQVKRIEEVYNAFGEHGTLKTKPVKIQLKENAQPYMVHTASRVPLLLIQKVKDELQHMEENRFIDWCAPMLPVPKWNCSVCICVPEKVK